MYVFPFYGSKFMYIESSYYLFSSKKHNTIIYNKVQLISPIFFPSLPSDSTPRMSQCLVF